MVILSPALIKSTIKSNPECCRSMTNSSPADPPKASIKSSHEIIAARCRMRTGPEIDLVTSKSMHCPKKPFPESNLMDPYYIGVMLITKSTLSQTAVTYLHTYFHPRQRHPPIYPIQSFWFINKISIVFVSLLLCFNCLFSPAACSADGLHQSQHYLYGLFSQSSFTCSFLCSCFFLLLFQILLKPTSDCCC